MVNLRQDGYSISDLSKKLGITYETIAKWSSLKKLSKSRPAFQKLKVVRSPAMEQSEFSLKFNAKNIEFQIADMNVTSLVQLLEQLK